MRNVMKNAAAGTVIGGSLLFTVGMGIAAAQPDTAPAPDGLVNVTLGSAGVLKDVKAADAAKIAAGVCDLELNQVTKMAETTEADGSEQMVCASSLGSVLIQQNVAAQAEGLPGQSESAPGHAPEAVPGQSGDEVPAVSSPAPATPQEPSTEHGR
jgi:hypothetical protein